MKNISILIMLAALIFASCGNPDDSGLQPTQIVLDNNANSLQVSVYDSWDKIPENIIAVLEGNQRSEEIDFSPHPQGFIFYPRYFFSVENISLFYDPPNGTNGNPHVAIPKGETTQVFIRPITDFILTGTALFNDVYLYIKNNGTSALGLHTGNTIIPSENGIHMVNPNETSLYKVAPGSASIYNILVTTNYFPFPSDLTLQPGHIYTLEFNGSFVTLVKDTAIAFCTVTYDINGGTGATPVAQTVSSGTGVTLPNGSGFTRDGYAFTGWNTSASGNGTNYNADASYTPAASITLFAKWESTVIVPGVNLAEKLSWLETNTASYMNYTVEVDKNENIEPTSLSFYGKNNIKIILKGTGTTRTISLSSNGSMFTVFSGVTLVLDERITLQGLSNNSNSLVLVNGGTLEMNTGAAITGNEFNSGYGGGLSVNAGLFNMRGGEISGNTASGGGGVYITNSGSIFNMGGGFIYGSNAAAGFGNIASNGAALLKEGGTAQYGSFDGDTFYRSGDLNTTDNNIRIVLGLLWPD